MPRLEAVNFQARWAGNGMSPPHGRHVANDAVPATASSLRAPLPSLPSDVAIGDLDDLLDAVRTRLSLTVGERLAALPPIRMNDDVRSIQASVQDCVSALDQLHATLRHDFGRRCQLELEALDAHSALAKARAELIGTRAGERRARHLSLHDTLTSLPNRSCFHERLEKALTLAEPSGGAVAVMYLDLDGFKRVNDSHGHHTGDEMLRIVAARLIRAVRADDTVSRLGGDEFACLVAGMPGRNHLSQLAGKLFSAVAAPFRIGELSLAVRPSIGIAMCPDDGATVDSLLQHADLAMYHAKRHQTGHAFFDQWVGE